MIPFLPLFLRYLNRTFQHDANGDNRLYQKVITALIIVESGALYTFSLIVYVALAVASVGRDRHSHTIGVFELGGSAHAGEGNPSTKSGAVFFWTYPFLMISALTPLLIIAHVRVCS